MGAACKNGAHRAQDYMLRISPLVPMSRKRFEEVSREAAQFFADHGFRMGMLVPWVAAVDDIVSKREVIAEAERRVRTGASPAMLQPQRDVPRPLRTIICAALNRRLALRATGLVEDWDRADRIGTTLSCFGLVWDYHLDTDWYLNQPFLASAAKDLRHQLRRADPKHPAWRRRKLSIVR